MPHRPRIARTLASLRRTLAALRAKGDTVALVPTMGALHAGHLSLVRLARRKADRVVVSIFVNPQQFGPSEDFATYPRTFETDIKALAAAGVDVVWAPGTVRTMYPQGFATRIELAGPATVGLEDAFRPHFFGGVATVVAKLLLQCTPDVALFGEKDYQQLRVVTRMAADLDLPVRIIGAPTMRERDGLAMSSRNVYLSKNERDVAPVLYRVLQTCARGIAGGASPGAVLARGRRDIAAAGFVLDYLEAREASTLAPVRGATGALRLLVAARLGRTRLIDNLAVPRR